MMNRAAFAWIFIFGSLACSGAPWDGPIAYVDSHIHAWTLPRDDGSTFPVGCCGDLDWLNRDFTIADYQAQRRGEDALGVVLVESIASVPPHRLLTANQSMLTYADSNPLILGVVGRLDLGSKSFVSDLETLTNDPRFVGLRVDDDIFTADGRLLPHAREGLECMARRHVVLESYRISPGQIAAVSASLPEGLTIVLDHFAGQGQSLELQEKWREGIRGIAAMRHVYVKVSDWQRMSAAQVGGAWPIPFQGLSTPESYREVLSFLMDTLGPDRLVFGTNWPVSNLAGPFGQQIEILHALLPDRPDIAEKIFRRNALQAYGMSADPLDQATVSSPRGRIQQ